MRIVAGKNGGRRLMVPKNRDIRPTSDKIRGAIMNMLRARDSLSGVRVLDAFCGTGALGLESLSQGAAYCLFIDKARESIDLAHENAKALGALPDSKFIVKDSARLGDRPETQHAFDLVFLDPPYNKDLIPEALKALHEGDWMHENAWIICETEKKFVGLSLPYIHVQDEKTYGDTKIILARYHTAIEQRQE